MLTKAIWADKEWAGFWQISLCTSSKTEILNKITIEIIILNFQVNLECFSVRGRSQTTFANFANFSPPTYLCLHWFTFGLPPTYHYTCKRLHVTNFYSNPKLGSLELQGKLKTFVLQKFKVKLKNS